MGSVGQKVKWSWSSALIGAATSLLSAKPKDPTFDLITIDLTSLKLNLPVLDAELMLSAHVTNPIIAAIDYSSTTMSILYDGTVLGTAEVKAGSQCRDISLETCITLKSLSLSFGLSLCLKIIYKQVKAIKSKFKDTEIYEFRPLGKVLRLAGEAPETIH